MPPFTLSSIFTGCLLLTINASYVKNVTVVQLNEESSSKPSEVRHISTETLNISYIEVPQDLDVPGAWTIFPLIARLARLSTSWVLVVNSETEVNAGSLPGILDSYDPSQSVFAGCALKDEEPTIIHHYSSSGLPFPHRSSGFLISSQLINRLSAALNKSSPDHTFSIDPAYEFAAYLNSTLEVQLIDDRRFCIGGREVSLISRPVEMPEGSYLPSDELFVAVKTYSGFHSNRIPVVQQTWGRETDHILYFSDVEDPSIPTISTGIPNTERGHCAKTAYILEHFQNLIAGGHNYKWLLIADDDTIISLSRLRQLLWRQSSAEPVIIGERYGYGQAKNGGGYDYITGGGGMVFSQSAVVKLLEGGCGQCPSVDTPDDMYLGACAKWQNIQIRHHEGFHQARPVDYPAQLLKNQFVISFHKHWNVDPVGLYNEWFRKGTSVFCKDEL